MEREGGENVVEACIQHDKIMTGGNLEDILKRLNGCRALLNVLYVEAGGSVVGEDAISGVRDLLDAICRDFQSDIEGAEDYQGPEGGQTPAACPAP